MNEKYLTARWNNLLSVALMLIAAVYVIIVQATGAMGSMGTFIGLIVIGGIT